MKEKEKIQLTTQAGVPVADNQNILTAGERGPALLQNVWYMEKLGHFTENVFQNGWYTQKAQEHMEI